MKKIVQIEEFETIFNNQMSFILLKNSITCPISHEAFNQTEKYAEENPDVPIYYLNVQESRELSNTIAERFDVKHESPQILLFKEGSVTWNTSHWKVTKKNLAEAWS